MELELNLLDWNVNELERELELEDMKRTIVSNQPLQTHWIIGPSKSIVKFLFRIKFVR